MTGPQPRDRRIVRCPCCGGWVHVDMTTCPYCHADLKAAL